MKSLKEIVTSVRAAIDSSAEIPDEEELRIAEVWLDFKFPESYREFVRLGGLGGLCINHRVFAPSEVLQSLGYLPDHDHVPFADNGCGDLCCWSKSDDAEPPVMFADHESGYTYSEDAESFTSWLEQNLF